MTIYSNICIFIKTIVCHVIQSFTHELNSKMIVFLISLGIDQPPTPPPLKMISLIRWEKKREKKKRCVKWLQIKELHISKSISSNIKHFISQQKKKSREKSRNKIIFSKNFFYLLSKWRALWGFLLLFVNRPSVLYWIGDPEVQYLYQFFEFYLFYTAIFMSWFILMIKYDE